MHSQYGQFQHAPGPGRGGRVGFAAVGLLIVAGIILLLDRAGAPARLLAVLSPLAGISALVLVGAAMRTMRISQFHVAGRNVPVAYGGLGLAGLAIALALPLLPQPFSLARLIVLAGGLAGGLLLATCFGGPLLRKSGAFTLAGLLGARFPGRAFRLASIVLVAGIAALVAMAGLAMAHDSLMLATGLARWPCAVLLGLALLFITLPGGLAGVAWAAVAAAGALATALAVSLALAGAQQFPLALPFVAESHALQAALAHVQDFSPVALIAGSSGEDGLVYVFGIAGLAPLLGLFAGASRASAASRIGIAGIFWAGVLAVLLLASMALSATALDRDIVGRKPGDLPELVYAASARGQLNICGKAVASPAAARAACAAMPGFAGVLAARDIAPAPLALVSTLAMVRNPPVAAASLVLAGLVMAGLALASAGLQTLAATLAHEGFHRLRDQGALTSRRLAIARAAMLCAVAGGVPVLVLAAPGPRGLVLLALSLSAAFVAPLMALLLWPLAQTRDAMLGLAAAGLFALVRGPAALAGYEDGGAVVTSIAGACLATGLLASLFHPDRTRPRRFFRALFAGGAEILPADKGA